MGKLSAVIGREFGERVRSRWFLLTTLFGPILFAALLIIPPWIASRTEATIDPTRLLFIDATGGRLGDAVAGDFAGGIQSSATPPAVSQTTPDSLDAATSRARARLLDGAISGFVVLDPATLSTGAARLVLRDGVPGAFTDRLSAALDRQIRRQRFAALGLSAEAADDVARVRVRVNTIRLDAEGREASARVNLLFGFGVAILLYIAIVLYGQIVLRSVTEEKQSRVSEVVLASVPARVLLAGKILGIGGVALVQLGLWTAAIITLLANRAALFAKFGIAAASVPLPSIDADSLVLLGAYFVMGYALYAALFAIVGSIATSEQEAQQAQTPVIMLLVASMALLQPALADPNGAIGWWLSLIPFSSPIMMPLRLGLTDVPTTEIVASIGVLGLTGVLALLAAGRVYRTALLMYGKRPSVREIFRWIRAAD
ncbi:MAG: ABC transporter permease [Gemmatimonadota bacterium]